MTLEDPGEFQPEQAAPIETAYPGRTVSEIPPNVKWIAALITLNSAARPGPQPN